MIRSIITALICIFGLVGISNQSWEIVILLAIAWFAIVLKQSKQLTWVDIVVLCLKALILGACWYGLTEQRYMPKEVKAGMIAVILFLLINGARRFHRRPASALSKTGTFFIGLVWLIVTVTLAGMDVAALAALSLALYWYSISHLHQLKTTIISPKPEKFEAVSHYGNEFFHFLFMYLLCVGAVDISPGIVVAAVLWFSMFALWGEAKQTAAKESTAATPTEAVVDLQPAKDAPDKIGTDIAQETPKKAVSAKKKAIPAKKNTLPVKEVKEKGPGISARIATFLSQNIVQLLLVLGVLFIFTAALTFLRIHWEDYKIWAFFSFVLVTATCFAVGYFIHYRKASLDYISFTLILLGCLFFPINFYFALKVGLIEDHGNRYQVLLLTSLLYVVHAWMLRSAVFTLMSTFVVTWANWATLDKFTDDYSLFAISFAIQALLFLAASFLSLRKHVEISGKIWQYAANVVLVFAVFTSIEFWHSHILSGVMFCAIVSSTAQILYFPNKHLRDFNLWCFPLAVLLFVEAFTMVLGMGLFWRGIPLVIVSFVAIYACLFLRHWNQEQTSNPILRMFFWAPPVILLTYVALGAYTSYASSWAICFVCLLASVGYFSVTKWLQNSSSVYLAAITSYLAIWEFLDIFSDNWLLVATILLLWGLVLSVWALKKDYQGLPWFYNPILATSQIANLLVLVSVAIVGPTYYPHQIGMLTVFLLFAIVFYSICAYKLHRTDMLFAGISLTVILCSLHAHWLNLNLQSLCIAMSFLALVLMGLGAVFENRGTIWQGCRWFSLPLILTFTILSFVSGLGYELWQLKVVMLLGASFFLAEYLLTGKDAFIRVAFLYASLFYLLLFYVEISVHYWGFLFSLAAIASLLLALSLKQMGVSIATHFYEYGRNVAALCCLQFAVYFRIYYLFSDIGEIFGFTLLVCSILMWLCNRSNIFVYSTALIAYAEYLLLLPRGLFPFQYALFFIPIAIVLLGFVRKYQHLKISDPVFRIAQISVLFFLGLPAVIPGVTPSALISMWVILLALIFYFLCAYFYRNPIYSYASSILFLCCVLAALFAKGLWGNQIALIMALANLVLLAIGIVLNQRSYKDLAYPLFVCALLCTFGIVGSALLQGKIDEPTLFTLLACSVFMASLSIIQQNVLFMSKNVLADASLVLFAISYYLLIEKLDTYAMFAEYKPFVDLQYLSLAFVALILSAITRKHQRFSQTFLYIAVIAPIFSLLRIQNTWNLCALMGLSGVLYGVIAWRRRDTFLAIFSLGAFVVSSYAYLGHYHGTSEHYMELCMVLGIVWAQLLFFGRTFFCDTRKSLEFLAPALDRVGYLGHIPFFALFFLDPGPNVYFAVIVSLVNSLLLAFVYLKSQRHLLLSVFSLLFAYYITIHHWSIDVWEFYTIPVGTLCIIVGYYMHHKHSYDVHKDALFLGLLLIMFPTFVQSYHGWFAHLYSLPTHEGGVSPTHHLYYTILLSIESLIILFLGLRYRKLIPFFCGLAFLLSDSLLMIFSYVNFGGIPQAVWWGCLGAALIISAWALEYRRQALFRLKDGAIAWKQRWSKELRSWD